VRSVRRRRAPIDRQFCSRSHRPARTVNGAGLTRPGKGGEGVSAIERVECVSRKDRYVSLWMGYENAQLGLPRTRPGTAVTSLAIVGPRSGVQW